VGRLADGASVVTGLVGQTPDHPFLHELLAEIRLQQNDLPEAAAAYSTALRGLEGEPRHADRRDEIREQLAALYLETERPEDAREILNEIELPDRPRAVELEARLALAARDWPETRRLARRLRALGEVARGALLEGELAVAEKRWSRAAARFREAIDLLGPRARGLVADIYRRGGRTAEGLELLRDGAESRPDDADARFQLGVYLYQIQRFEDAEPELQAALRLDPLHAPALNFLGYSLAERRVRLDEALEMVRRALEVDAWNAAYLDSLGWVYYQMGRFDEAREPLERAAREMPKDATVLEHLGDVYLQLGERRRALAAWDRALAARPEDPEALRGKIDSQRASEEASGALPDSDAAEAPPRSGGSPPRR
jgi:tetratricopeptide (TPR) repeat protein